MSSGGSKEVAQPRMGELLRIAVKRSTYPLLAWLYRSATLSQLTTFHQALT